MSSPSADHGEPLIFRQHSNAERPSGFKLRACAGASDHNVGLLGYGPATFAPRLSARAFASSRVIRSSEPVKTR